MRNSGLIFAALFSLCSLVGPGARADDASRHQEDLNAGYYLLHTLLEDEENLPFLLDIKTAPPEIQDFAKTISRTAKSGLATLGDMRARDPAINWDRNPLPRFEQAVRDSIKGEKEHQLLFGTKGPEFARALLVSQTEASKYAANITKVLAGRETNPGRVRELQRMSRQWHALYDEAFRLLRNY